MENIITIRSLRKKLNQVVLHEQMENGVAINNNLCRLSKHIFELLK